MHMNDIAVTFQLLGFVRYVPSNESVKLGICVDWNRVENHMKKLKSRPRLEIDPECLRWTPLLAPTVNPFRSPEEGSGDQDTENDDTEMKTESENTETEPETVATKAETKSKVENEAEETPVEVTSSGRRRTRPLKYSETTYQTTPTLGDGSRKRKRETNRKISESLEEEKKEPEATPRRQRSKSVARSKVAQDENSEGTLSRNRRKNLKEPAYVSDSQESQESNDIQTETPDTPSNASKSNTTRQARWKGRKRQKASNKPARKSSGPSVAKKPKIDEDKQDQNDYKTDDSVEESAKNVPESVPNHVANNQKESKPEKDKNLGESSEDSSGEADDEMDVEEGDDRTSVPSKPATPRPVEENSTDHHTSDMELDSIHMDSPKSVAEKDQVISETNKDKNEEESNILENGPITTLTEENMETKITQNNTESIKTPETRNGEIKSPAKTLEDKDTIVISESDDNNSQSCPLPSPKPSNLVPAQTDEFKSTDVLEKDSPQSSKVLPVVSTENSHIVLDAKGSGDALIPRPPVDLIVPRMHQIETIVVEGESDAAISPQIGVSPKNPDKSVISESPKQKKSPEKVNSEMMCEQKKTEMRKETVIQHQTNEEAKVPEKKSPTKIETIIQNLDLHRDLSNSLKKPDTAPKIDSYNEIDTRKLQMPITSKESEISFRNDMLITRKDEIVVSRSIIENAMPNYHNSVSNSMTIQPINSLQMQHPYLNHRNSVSKESQAIQTDKVLIKTSDPSKTINNMSDSLPVISKSTTKLEVPHPITSPIVNPVIPKVPNVTDISFLPRCQSANAAVNLGMERTDLDPNFTTNALQNTLSSSMSIVQTNSQDNKSDPNQKPREKSKLRDVRVNSAHSKLEKSDKKSAKNETLRSTPEPKLFFPEQNTNARKPETSVPINVINTVSVTSKLETKTSDAPKKQDYFKKEKSNAAKCESKNASVKHDKSCSTQLNLKAAEQNDLNKMIPKFKYDNDFVPKADYAMNQIPNYHTTPAQYPMSQWPPWDPTRTWDHNRFLDMKNNDKNYLDKFQGFNLPHLDQMQKSPQKLHTKYDQKDFHNIAYGALSSGIYATTGLPHFKETKAPTSKASDCTQKNECKPTKQSKTTTACQTQCESKKSQSHNTTEAQMKQMMQRQVNKQQDVVTSCAEFRQQSPQVMTSPGCKSFNQNGPCQEKSEIDKKSRQQKKDESLKDTSKEEMCEAVSPAMQSMGVYTPDSTSNSVHSVQYPACELDVSQLGLESPTSIGSDLASPCSIMHMHPAPSPQYPHSSIHIPSIMSQPNQPAKQQKINNRNR